MDFCIKGLRGLSLVILAGLMAGALVAPSSAFVLKMDGQAVETASALYEHTSDRRLVRVAQIGDRVAGGGRFLEFGTPAIAPNGAIVFGAEVSGERSRRWGIFVAQPNRDGSGIAEAFDNSAIGGDCRPLLKTDPFVMTDAKGSIFFLAPEASGPDALFRYSGGKLSCEMRVGDRTREGHRIASLHFGSAQTAENGAVVLSAGVYVDDNDSGRHLARNGIILVEPPGRIRAIALEGRPAPGVGRYSGHFGLPAVSSSAAGVVVAFADRDAKGGSSLFFGRPGQLARTAYTGLTTAAGPITYLSDGRPGLSDDGSVAIRIASGDRSSIAVIRAGEPRVVAREGDVVHGARIEGLGDPAAMFGGRVYVEETDPQERVHILSCPATEDVADTASAVAGGVEVFPNSLAVNRGGELAFLANPKQGGAPHSNAPASQGDQDGTSI